jgi:predicted PurR-regulated permease PerM
VVWHPPQRIQEAAVEIRNPFRVGFIGALGVGLALLIFGAITNLAGVITDVGAALFLALGMEPLIAFLIRHRFSRALALTATLLAFVVATVALLLVALPIVVSQAIELTKSATRWVQSGEALKVVHQLHRQFPTIVNQGNLDKSTAYLQSNIAGIGGGVLRTGVAVAGGATAVVIVLILTIYFTAALPSIRNGATLLLPASRRARFTDLGDQIIDSVGRYVVGQLALALINAVLSLIVLTIIGARFPLLLAIVAFVFSLIPLIGTVTGSAIIVLACLTASPLTALIAAAYYLVYMQVEAYVLSPRIMKRAVQVPGAVSVIAAIAGGTLLGILGALVAVPFAAAIILIIKQVVVPRQNAR